MLVACSVRKEQISQMHGMEYQFYRLRKDFAAGDIGNRQAKTENQEYLQKINTYILHR